METPTLNLTDHDLLIRLDTRMGNITDEMRLLRDGTTNDIKDLKKDKLDRREFEDYKRDHDAEGEKIVKKIDEHFAALDAKSDRAALQIAAVGGALLVMQFVIPLLLKYWFHLG